MLRTSIPPLISVLYATGYHEFPLKNFRLTVPKKFVEEPVCVSENFGYRKTSCRRGEYHNFLKKISCLTVPKNFVVEPFFSQSFWCQRKLCGRAGGGGGITIFRWKVFVPLYKTNSLKKTLVFQKSFLSKTFMHRRGAGHHGFVENFCLTGLKRKVL